MVFNYSESCDQDLQKGNMTITMQLTSTPDGSFSTFDEDSLLLSEYKFKNRFLNSLFDFHYVNTA